MERELGDDLNAAFQRDKVMAIFQQWDTHQTGVIDRDELTEALTNLGVDASKSAVDKFFDDADLDRDGVISYKEFVKHLFQPDIKAEAIANLQKRFPDASMELLAVVLANTGGHSGHAAKALENLVAKSQEVLAQTAPSEPASVPICVLMLGGEGIHILIDRKMSISEFKASLEEKCGIPSQEQALIIEGTKLADDSPIGDLPVDSDGKFVPLTLVRVRSTGLLCADSLKRFHAKNISDSAITLKVASLVRTLDAGQECRYAEPDFWDSRYFDLDLVKEDGTKSGSTIATENGVDQDKFIVEAVDEFGHREHWGMQFHVSGYDCSAKITKAPAGRDVELS